MQLLSQTKTVVIDDEGHTANIKDKSHKFYLLKTITWRVIASLDTLILTWWLTGNLSVGFAIGGAEVFTKMFLYFIHEEMWHRASKGEV